MGQGGLHTLDTAMNNTQTPILASQGLTVCYTFLGKCIRKPFYAKYSQVTFDFSFFNGKM